MHSAVSQKQAPWSLAYLFAAHFADGSEILQTAEDISALKSGASAFHDVLVRASEVNLVSFALYNSERVYAVDLRDGHFEIKLPVPAGGIVTLPFTALPVASPQLPPGGGFRLLFFRDHQQDILSSPKESRLGEHRVFYRLGWEYDVLISGELQTFTQAIVIS